LGERKKSRNFENRCRTKRGDEDASNSANPGKKAYPVIGDVEGLKKVGRNGGD